MPPEPTQALADFAATLRFDAIPERTREACKDLLLDALACALAGHQGEETAQLAALAGALGQSDESSVIGGDRLSLAGATLLNGYLITAVTMCDTYRELLTHIMPEVLPPALAIAERDALSGRDLLVALAAGSEVAIRVGLGLDYPVFRAKGWHGPGVLGPFGAAAAVGRLRGFDADTMARAFGLAGSQSAGTFAAWGTPTVKFHQCRGALSGLMAALLAEQEFVATREFLTEPDGGLYNTYAEGGKPDAALAGLGIVWELEKLALRPWPSASSIQGMITAMIELTEQHEIDPAQVKQVRIALSPPVFKLHGGFATYGAKFEAMLSAHYVATAILHDRALTLAQFEPARYDSAALRRFAAERVLVTEDAKLSGLTARAEIETANGAVLSSRCEFPRGAPENPLGRARIVDKFRTYAAPRLSQAGIETVIDAVARLEEMKSVAELFDMLRAAPRPARRSA